MTFEDFIARIEALEKRLDETDSKHKDSVGIILYHMGRQKGFQAALIGLLTSHNDPATAWRQIAAAIGELRASGPLPEPMRNGLAEAEQELKEKLESLMAHHPATPLQ